MMLLLKLTINKKIVQLLLSITIGFVYGCGNSNVKDNLANNHDRYMTITPLTPFEHYNEGLALYKKWSLNKSNLVYLKDSNLHFKHAFEARPFNVAIQTLYYETLADYGYYLTDDLTEQDLDVVFTQLLPEIKLQSAAPAKIMYARMVRKQQPPLALLPYLKRAVKQKPYDAHTWQQLSTQYTKLKRYDMAISTAYISHTLSPDTAYSNMTLAKAYNQKVQNSSCFYEDKVSTKKSAFYAAKAAKIEENEYHNGFAGLQYLRLGLYPLAYQFASKAHNKSPDKWNTSLLVDTLFNLGRYEQAVEFANKETGDKKHYVDISKSLVAASKNNWQETAIWYDKSDSTNTIYKSLLLNWFQSLEAKKPIPIHLEENIAQTSWEKKIKLYFDYPEVYVDSTLLDAADTSCTKIDAHFYTAMRLWRRGNIDKAKEHLILTTKQGVPRYKEHLFAKLIHSAI